MKRILTCVILVTIVLSLVACKKGSFKVRDTQHGTWTVYYEKKGVDIVKTSGPFIVKITDIEIGKVKLEEKVKKAIYAGDENTYILIGVETVNQDIKPNVLYPDEGYILLNTEVPEMQTGELIFSNSFGGTFMGNESRTGQVIFILENPIENIKGFKYGIDSAKSLDRKSIGEDIEFEIRFDYD